VYVVLNRRKVKKTHFALSALFGLLAFAPVALPVGISFSFSGGGISSSGTFTVSPTSTPGFDEITSISGTFSDTNDGISGAITGLYQPVSYAAPQPPSYTAPPPAFTSSGFSYDDTFYPAGNSPHNCADYPFFGGEFDIYGVAFDVAGGYVGDLWSDGKIPGLGLVYAAGDGNATTLLDDPNPTGANTALPVGVPVALVTSPEPGSLFLLGIGLLAMVAILARKSTALAL
jgi:hypothetical protein